MRRVRPPKPISGGLILSYQCTAECRHCMYACSPKWKGWMPEERLEKILSQLAGNIEPSPHSARRVSLNYGLHFTGGEPFVIRDIVRILASALEHRSCLVLTNATEPLIRRLSEILPLADLPNALSFRVSIDYPDAELHDKGRGKGNFSKALLIPRVSFSRLKGSRLLSLFITINFFSSICS